MAARTSDALKRLVGEHADLGPRVGSQELRLLLPPVHGAPADHRTLGREGEHRVTSFRQLPAPSQQGAVLVGRLGPVHALVEDILPGTVRPRHANDPSQLATPAVQGLEDRGGDGLAQDVGEAALDEAEAIILAGRAKGEVGLGGDFIEAYELPELGGHLASGNFDGKGWADVLRYGVWHQSSM